MSEENPQIGVAGSAHETDQSTIYSGLSVQIKPAPVFKRMLAYCVDLSIVWLSFCLVLFVGVFFFAGSVGIFAALSQTINGEGGMFFGVATILMFLCVLLVMLILHDGYFIYFEYKKNYTPGKQIFGLKVVSLNQNRLSLGQVILRHLFRYVDCLLVVPGLISMAVSQRRQRIGDLVASTVVVHSGEKEKISDFMYLKPEDYYFLKESLNPGRIPEHVGKAFLRFSYPHFVLNRPADANTLAHWEREIRNFLPAGATLERDVLLRFFAEWCLQSTRTK